MASGGGIFFSVAAVVVVAVNGPPPFQNPTRFASLELQGDRETVLAAARQNAAALEWAHSALAQDQGDEAICRFPGSMGSLAE